MFAVSQEAFNASYLAVMAAAVAIILLIFYHKREPSFGMTSLYLTLGIFLNMEDVLASVMSLDIGWGLKTNPGSAVLFPANLLIVLLLYKMKTADELKKLCVVLVSVNVMVAAVSLALSVLVGPGSDPGSYPFLLKLFSARNSAGVILSSVLLAVDIIVILVVYDKLEPAWPWVRLAGPLLASLCVDSLGYSGLRALVFGDPFRVTVASHLACKTAAGLLYATLLWAYLKGFERDDLPSTAHVRGMFLRFLKYLFYISDYKEIRKDIVVDPVTGLHVKLRESLSNYLKESRRTGQPVITLYMLKLRGYARFKGRLAADDYAALRAALSRVARLVFLHDRANGTLALIFMEHVDGSRVRDEIARLLNTTETVGLHGTYRRWPTDTGRLEFVDFWGHFDPDEKTYYRADDFISDVVRGLTNSEFAEGPPSDAPAPSVPEPVGASVGSGRADPWSASAATAEATRPGRRPGAPVMTKEGRAVTAEAVMTTYKGFVEAVHDGVAYLNLEDEDGQRVEIEWDARDLAAKKIVGEHAPFLLTTREVGDEVAFDFRPDQPGEISEATRSEIQALLSHYRATGDLDD